MKQNILFNIQSARWGQFMAEVLSRRPNAAYSDTNCRPEPSKSGGKCWDIALIYKSHFRFENGISDPMKR